MYDGLVLSSGGIRGFLHLGFLDNLYSYITNVKYYCGCSVGAYICMLLSIGYTPLEIMIYLCTNDISQLFKDLNPLLLTDFYGMVNNESMLDYIEIMVKYKVGYIPTFKQLYDEFGKVLIIPSYNITDNEKVYFSHETHPDMLITRASLLSSNIPFLFTKAEYKGKCYIDGATFDYFPVDKLVSCIGNDPWLTNCKILAVKFEDDEKQDINTLVNYTKKIINCIIKSTYTIPSNVSLGIISSTNVDISNYNIDTQSKIQMYLEGYKQARKFYSKNINKQDKEI
jgi:predicted patatin/cPLA2 family phospholipase